MGMANDPDEASQDRDLIDLKNALKAADRTATTLSTRIFWLNVGLLLFAVILVGLEV
jgi:hypothetical protein